MQCLKYLGSRTESILYANGINCPSERQVQLGFGVFLWDQPKILEATVGDGDHELVMNFDIDDPDQDSGYIYNSKTKHFVEVIEADRLNEMAEYMLQLMYGY